MRAQIPSRGRIKKVLDVEFPIILINSHYHLNRRRVRTVQRAPARCPHLVGPKGGTRIQGDSTPYGTSHMPCPFSSGSVQVTISKKIVKSAKEVVRNRGSAARCKVTVRTFHIAHVEPRRLYPAQSRLATQPVLASWAAPRARG